MFREGKRRGDVYLVTRERATRGGGGGGLLYTVLEEAVKKGGIQDGALLGRSRPS